MKRGRYIEESNGLDISRECVEETINAIKNTEILQGQHIKYKDKRYFEIKIEGQALYIELKGNEFRTKFFSGNMRDDSYQTNLSYLNTYTQACEELFEGKPLDWGEEFGEEVINEQLNELIAHKFREGKYKTTITNWRADRDGVDYYKEELEGVPIPDVHYKGTPEINKDSFLAGLRALVVEETAGLEYKDKELEELKGLEVGSCLHEDWRQTRRNEDGTYEPRWKRVKDTNFKFVESDTCRKNEEGVVEIDIANRSFGELSADWQYENLEAGKVVARLVGDKTELTPEEVEQMASEIHDEWLKRNDWVYDGNYGNPAQAVPYDKLSEEEKQKDRAQLKFGLSLNEKLLSGEIKKKDLKEKFKSNEEQIVE